MARSRNSSTASSRRELRQRVDPLGGEPERRPGGGQHPAAPASGATSIATRSATASTTCSQLSRISSVGRPRSARRSGRRRSARRAAAVSRPVGHRVAHAERRADLGGHALGRAHARQLDEVHDRLLGEPADHVREPGLAEAAGADDRGHPRGRGSSRASAATSSSRPISRGRVVLQPLTHRAVAGQQLGVQRAAAPGPGRCRAGRRDPRGSARSAPAPPGRRAPPPRRAAAPRAGLVVGVSASAPEQRQPRRRTGRQARPSSARPGHASVATTPRRPRRRRHLGDATLPPRPGAQVAEPAAALAQVPTQRVDGRRSRPVAVAGAHDVRSVRPVRETRTCSALVGLAGTSSPQTSSTSAVCAQPARAASASSAQQRVGALARDRPPCQRDVVEHREPAARRLRSALDGTGPLGGQRDRGVAGGARLLLGQGPVGGPEAQRERQRLLARARPGRRGRRRRAGSTRAARPRPRAARPRPRRPAPTRRRRARRPPWRPGTSRTPARRPRRRRAAAAASRSISTAALRAGTPYAWQTRGCSSPACPSACAADQDLGAAAGVPRHPGGGAHLDLDAELGGEPRGPARSRPTSRPRDPRPTSRRARARRRAPPRGAAAGRGSPRTASPARRRWAASRRRRSAPDRGRPGRPRCRSRTAPPRARRGRRCGRPP